MIKGSIHQEDRIIINIYAPKIKAPKFLKQILTDLKEEDNNTVVVRIQYPTFSNGQIIQSENQQKHWI